MLISHKILIMSDQLISKPVVYPNSIDNAYYYVNTLVDKFMFFNRLELISIKQGRMGQDLQSST